MKRTEMIEIIQGFDTDNEEKIQKFRDHFDEIMEAVTMDIDVLMALVRMEKDPIEYASDQLYYENLTLSKRTVWDLVRLAIIEEDEDALLFLKYHSENNNYDLKGEV